MTSRALLIGSETYGLSGCNADVELMETVLSGRGFTEIELLTGSAATRSGILVGFEQLISASAKDDAAVVYYSGHGGRFPRPDWEARQAAGHDPFVQFVVPSDMGSTTAIDFRGVLSVELSELQLRLTEKTRNVTTILDCCHSGLMSRDAVLIPKAVSRAFPADAALERLGEIDARLGARPAESNPNAVRVVACAPTQSAFEGPSQFRPGERHGLLTDALARLLEVIGTSQISWQTLGQRLRLTIGVMTLTQRPEVEGPSRRILFTMQEDERVGALPVQVSGADVWVGGAELLGVAPGDQYMLLDGDGKELGRATAGSQVAGRARLNSDDAGHDQREFSAAVTAVPVRTAARFAVWIDLPGELGRQVATAIEESPSVSVSETAAGTIASVVFEEGLVVVDPAGLPMHLGRLPVDDDGVREVVRLLESVARGQRFRALEPMDPSTRLSQPVDVTISRHNDDGTDNVLAGSGERLFVGDRLSVTVRNLSDQPLFYWLFDVGTDSTIALVTQASPSGRELSPAGTPGSTGTFGGLDSPGLVWSTSLPTDGARPETFVVIVADGAQDLSLLATRDSSRAVPESLSPLQAELDQAINGIRDWPAELPSAASLRYRVDMWDIILEPTARPRFDEPEFTLDERPDLSLRVLVPRGASPPPDKVAVRLQALSVRKNRALFRATVRLDAMVITGDQDGRAIATPVTQRFPDIADGDLLPMENLLLYVGPVHEFLDIAIWVNRDDEKGASLADLFASELSQPAVQSALTVVGGLVLAAPTVAAGVGAVVAVAELVRVGAKLVSAAVGKNIGLYRTSLLPFESFGIGRHPEGGLQEAQNIQFAYEVRAQP